MNSDYLLPCVTGHVFRLRWLALSLATTGALIWQVAETQRPQTGGSITAVHVGIISIGIAVGIVALVVWGNSFTAATS